MTLIRLSDIEKDRQILVNLDHIVHVSAKQGPRGLQRRAFSLELHLSDGSHLTCFPVDEYGGFDAVTNDESEIVHNFQQAAQHLRDTPEVIQGRPNRGD